MDKFISNSDYVDAVRSGAYFESNLLIPLKLANNFLHMETGQNAVVFKLRDMQSGGYKALKLFNLRNREAQQTLVDIARYLSKLNQKHLVKFEYRQDFIELDLPEDETERVFPAVLMDWAEGDTLGTRVADLVERQDLNALGRLSASFTELSNFILQSDFGHGDIKHDNLIVGNKETLKLVDYDGVFIPGFVGRKSSELGTPSFQHPARNTSHFGPDIDHFSILSMHISLTALAISPKLYKTYNDEQNLLFTPKDFQNLASSAIYRDLYVFPQLRNLLTVLTRSLQSNDIYIPQLAEYLNGDFPKPEIALEQAEYKVGRDRLLEISFRCHDYQELKICQDNQSLPSKAVTIEGEAVMLRTKFHKNSTLNIVAKGEFEEVTATIYIKVTESFSYTSMRFSKSAIEELEKVTCNFEAKHYQKVTLKARDNIQFQIDIPKTRRSIEFQPPKSDEYYLEFTDLSGEQHQKGHKSIAVCNRILIRSFSADLYTTLDDFPIQLRWDIVHADRIILIDNHNNRQEVSNSHTIKLHPDQDTIYHLECRNRKFKQSSIPIHVHVRPNPHKLSLEKMLPSLDQLLPPNLLTKIDLAKVLDIDLPNVEFPSPPSIDIQIDADLNIEVSKDKKIKSLYKQFKQKLNTLIKETRE